LNRNESGRFGALKSDSTHHFFRNVLIVTFRMTTYNQKNKQNVRRAGECAKGQLRMKLTFQLK
jgi:hypothetical protein